MELATNTFNKGLQLDTHPMVLGTDVLSDCLNGTLLTMNGNEVVLLNDMGNRRVNNTFLPSGYLPVGMKEYGGIIYVAAYNPITNRSLIGSFPSPQKKIELNNLELNGISINLKDLEKSTEDPILGIKILNNDSILVPLTGENSLRAGDKFALYSPNIYKFKNYISNFDNVNIENRKVCSPKNKRYTLSVGILNSLNEFVDITKTLCRWNENNKIVNYDSSYSDIYIFNDKYFISKDFSNENFLETINDSELIKARLKIATNTYAYKLVGPMYIKAQLNHVESFDYNIFGVRNDNGTANIWIEGYLTYNCPDGCRQTELVQDDENYMSYGEGIPNFSGFDLIAKQSNDNLEVISPSEDPIIEKSVYNPITNLYSTKITKKYENISSNNNGIFDYVIGVNAITEEPLGDDLSGVYLKGLSVKDSLNIEDLGSNKIELSGWKFYNNVNGKYTLLTITLKAFPELGKKFSHLIFKFENIKKPNKVFTLECDNVYNGKLTLRIDWDNLEIFKNNSPSKKIFSKEIYRVTATYDVINEKTNKIEQESVVLQDITEKSLDSTETITILGDENNTLTQQTENSDETLTEEDNETPTETPTETLTETPTETSTEKSSSRWILFTELFNEFYNNLGISDYCTIEKSDNNTNTEYETEFLDKLSITLDTDLALIDTYEEELPVVTGKLIDTEADLDYKITHRSIFKFESGNSKIVIPDSDLYPIEITRGENNLEISNIKSNISENFQPQTLGTYGDFTEESWYTTTKTKNEYIYTITYYDHFIGKSSNPIQNVANIFCPLTRILTYVSPKDEYGFCGIGVNVNEIYGRGADYHYLDVITGYSQIIHAYGLGNVDTDNLQPTNGNRIASRLVNTLVNYLFNDYSSEIFQLFNEGTNDNLMFTYLVIEWNTYASSLADADWYSGWYLTNNHARVQVVRAWWKTSDGGWAQFPNNPLCTYEKENENSNQWIWKSPNISSIIPIPEKYVYCIVNDLSTITDGTLRNTIIGNNINFYATTDLSECQYNLPYNIYVEFPITYEISDNITLTTPSIGNLKFLVKKPENLTYNYTKTLKSSEAFYEAINTLDTSVVSNIFYDGTHLLTEDDKGNKLDPNVVYEKYTENVNNVETVKLKVSSDLRYFVVDRSKLSNDGINLLLYNSKDMGTPKFRYNRIGDDGDSRTCLDFRSSRIVNSKILE